MKMLLVLMVGLGVGCGLAQSSAPGPGAERPMTFADLMAMKRVSDPQVSPSGKWVMFSVTDVSLEKNTKVNHLWVVGLNPSEGTPLDGKTPARQVTFGDEGQSGGRFSPDGTRVLVVSGAGGMSQIWVAGWDEVHGAIGGAAAMDGARPLTTLSTEADGGVWSPDSKRILFVSEVWPECSVRQERGRTTENTEGKRGHREGAATAVSLVRQERGRITENTEEKRGHREGVATAVSLVRQERGRTTENTEEKRGHREGVATVVSLVRQERGRTTENTEEKRGHREGAATAVSLVRQERGRTTENTEEKREHGGQAGFMGLQAASWAEEEACDKAMLAAMARTPVKAQVWDGLLYRHWDHYVGDRRSHVLVVSATDGEDVRDLTPASVVGDAETPTFSLGGPLGYAWAPDSKEIAYVTNLDKVPAASTNNDVFTLRLDEARAKAVKVSTSLGSDDGPAYSPDGKYLAFRSQARAGFESDRFRLMVMDREKKTAQDILPQLDNGVDEFCWGPRSAILLFTAPDKGEEPIQVVAVQEHSAGSHQTRVLPYTGEFSELQISAHYDIVAMRMRVDHPAQMVSIASPAPDAQGNLPPAPGVVDLTHLNDAVLSRVELSAMESFEFTGAEGTKVQGFVVRPPGFDAAKKYPVKFLIHGGPQGAWGDGWSYRWNAELMAASGYVVVMVNPRGSTGYGQRFVDEVSGDWGGRAYEDLMKGLDAAEAKYSFIDKTRECALGASYGGYMADWILTHTNRFKCIVTHDGMYDPESAYGDTEEMWFNEWEFRRKEDFPKGWDGFSGGGSKGVTVGQTAEGRPGQPWRYAGLTADQDPFRRWSPMRFIQNAKTPTLVIHSQKDYRLDVSQGMALFTALQRLNVPSKMLYFPDEGHWVLKPKNSELWNEVVGDWCDRWTKTGKYAEGR